MTVTIKGATTIKGNTTIGFTPASLFAAGEQGVWYDPSDFSTMFQDTAGTTPVTATGQSVARINDKSGRGNNATQSTSANRPTLQQDANGCYYLSFDGANDNLETGNINFTSTNKMSVFFGVRKLSDAAQGTVTELSVNSSTNPGTFRLDAPRSNTENYGFVSAGTTPVAAIIAAGYAAPITNVATGIGDISAPSVILRLNGTQVASSTSSQGTGNYGTYPLYIGSRAGTLNFYNGNLYGLIVRGASSTSDQITVTENWMNAKTRAY